MGRSSGDPSQSQHHHPCLQGAGDASPGPAIARGSHRGQGPRGHSRRQHRSHRWDAPPLRRTGRGYESYPSRGACFQGARATWARRLSRGDLLAFLDADTIPAPGWLDELERALSPGVEMVSGAVLDGTPNSPWGTVGYMLEFLEWVPERRLPLGHAVRVQPACATGGVRACRRLSGGPVAGRGHRIQRSLRRQRHPDLRAASAGDTLNRVGRRAMLTHQRRLGASWVGVCARVSVPGRALAVPHLAPVAVLGRFYSIVKQLLRYPSAPRRLAWHAPLIVAGLAAWGVGVWRASGAQPPRS